MTFHALTSDGDHHAHARRPSKGSHWLPRGILRRACTAILGLAPAHTAESAFTRLPVPHCPASRAAVVHAIRSYRLGYLNSPLPYAPMPQTLASHD